MGLGDMLGKAMDAVGGNDEMVSQIATQLGEGGIDLSALTNIDADSFTALLEGQGIDLSILETLGLSVEDIIEKVKEHLA